MVWIKIPKKAASNKVKTPPEKPAIAPVVDKITLTLKLPPHDFGAVTTSVYKAIQTHPAFHTAKKSPRFDVVQLIALPASSERVHFMFGAKKSYLPDARLNFNPAKLGPDGMAGLHEVLSSIFPGGWDYMVAHGRVSEVEIAVDFPGIRMHHFSVLPDQVLTMKTYEDQAKLKTVYVGKPKGNQLKVYSKSYELWVKTSKKKGPKGSPIVRVEKRLKNLGKALYELDTLDNPLLAFELVAHPTAPPLGENKPYLWTLFLDSVAQRGLGPALKLLPQNKMSVYRKHFAAHVEPWWDPITIWGHWPSALKQSRLLPG